MRTTLNGALVATALLAAPIAGPAQAAAIVPGFNSTTLPANDDDSTDSVALGFSFNFYGTSYSTAFVNNNGNITFASALGTFTAFPLLSTNAVIIAPFFADVDTTGAGSGIVSYGTGTSAASRPSG